MAAADDFERQFPNEPMAPWATGRSSKTTFSGGYIAPGNPFAPVPVGEPGINVARKPAGENVSQVGPSYVFVRGEGFVEVRDSPYFEDSPPTDWERVSAAYTEAEETPPPIVYADIPVIDPALDPKGTVAETSSGDYVAVKSEGDVAFWDDLGGSVGSILGDVASAWIQGWPQTASPVYTAPSTYAGSGPGYQAYIGQPLAQAAPRAPAPPPPQ